MRGKTREDRSAPPIGRTEPASDARRCNAMRLILETVNPPPPIPPAPPARGSATGAPGGLPLDAPPSAERELVQRCLDGDAAAWRALYDRHFAHVDRLVHALGIRDAEADDLCQEIFVS